MDGNEKRLWECNIQIGEAEAAGDQNFFEALLAPAFAFMRANGDIVDRERFLRDVSKSSARHTQVESVTVISSNRAIVTCLVQMGENLFHNVRLFVRKPEQDWRLLAWANEGIDLN